MSNPRVSRTTDEALRDLRGAVYGDELMLPPQIRKLRHCDVRSLAVALLKFRDEFQGNRITVNFDRLVDLRPDMVKHFESALQNNLDNLQHVSIALSEEVDSDEEDEASGDQGTDDDVSEDDGDIDSEQNEDGDSDDDITDQGDNHFGRILKAFLEGLAKNSKVSSLQLHEMHVGSFCANFFCATSPRLKTVSFVRCSSFAYDDLKATFEAISKSQIEVFRFEGCGEPNFFLGFVKAVTQVDTLRVLVLKPVLLSRRVETVVRDCITGTNLKELVLQGSGKLTETLVQGLQATSLDKLKLTGFSLAENGMRAFRSYLCNHKWLGELKLWILRLDQRELQELFAGLRCNKTLRVLSLEYYLRSDTLVGHLSECGAMIGQLLRDNDHLKDLELDSNGLTDEVLEGLASGLRENRALS